MNSPNRKIDHIVYCVPNLEDAITHLEKQLGIKPSIGGKHTSKGTKNALINLGNACYLEILAIDHENLQVKGPRWMGIDLINKPKITRFCLKSNDLAGDHKILKEYNPKMGMIETGRRQTTDERILSWQMILPLATPEVELMPFMTDWSTSTSHPTDNLPAECELIDLTFYHTDPELIQHYFDRLNYRGKVVKADEVSIEMKVRGLNGEVVF